MAASVKLTVSNGDRQVHIQAKGASRKLLRELEGTAARLLAAAPPAAPAKAFGFSLTSDTELSGQDCD